MKNYPSTKDYKKAITEPASFTALKKLRACYSNNDLHFATGEHAIVFKMHDDQNNYYALKCFTNEQPLRKIRFISAIYNQ